MQNKSTYLFHLILIISIILGGITGYFSNAFTFYLKPLGEIFLNLIFTTIVPLIFFSIANAIARSDNAGKLGKIFLCMALVFLLTSLLAAIYSLFIVTLFPPADSVNLALQIPAPISAGSISSQIVGIFSVSNFSQILSHENILPLIVFSLLVGVASRKSGSENFIALLQAGEQIFMRVFTIIMYFAPIGFFAYFAVLMNEMGPKLINSYVKIAVFYHVFALLYFFLAFTLYAFLAGKKLGVQLFWRNLVLPLVTALATCSSAATIPANLQATKKMRVPPDIYETVIPLGTMIHKDGSVIGGMFKIAFLFSIFHISFSGASVLFTAIGVSILVGTVMGAIPSGGMLGELLILNIYGFPPSALLAIAVISIIIDPLATMINVTGNSVSSMLIARLVNGKTWFN